ncbi:hypothetical protein [Streptomyces sp. N35]|uniref:hypothetical protein n=1 Tax=Streptomyces sp. N35 TaxID=2795730 RepID=UPI0018F753AB|nr:hypothetical protein [Streptomyces sp. N35]
MRRWVKLSVLGVAVLGLVGYCGKPYATDWWVARQACGGVLPDGVVDELNPDGKRLEAAEEKRIEGLASYYCSVTYDSGGTRSGTVVEVGAYTHRDQVDNEFWRVFENEGWTEMGLLPGGLPGITDQFGAVQLLRNCPALGKDDDGRPRRMLVRATAGYDENVNAKDAVLRAAVAVANHAAQELGCGASPLKTPAHALSRTARPVPVHEARDTGCGFLADAGLPAGTTVRSKAASAGPAARCELFFRAGYDPAGDELAADEYGRPDAMFGAWYGDWSNRLVAYDGKRHSGTSAARCDGEDANFSGWANDDTGLSDRRVRELVRAFAQDQGERRGCTDVHAVQPG